MGTTELKTGDRVRLTKNVTILYPGEKDVPAGSLGTVLPTRSVVASDGTVAILPICFDNGPSLWVDVDRLEIVRSDGAKLDSPIDKWQDATKDEILADIAFFRMNSQRFNICEWPDCDCRVRLGYCARQDEAVDATPRFTSNLD